MTGEPLGGQPKETGTSPPRAAQDPGYWAEAHVAGIIPWRCRCLFEDFKCRVCKFLRLVPEVCWLQIKKRAAQDERDVIVCLLYARTEGTVGFLAYILR